MAGRSGFVVLPGDLPAPLLAVCFDVDGLAEGLILSAIGSAFGWINTIYY
jgi:hypothetical protein